MKQRIDLHEMTIIESKIALNHLLDSLPWKCTELLVVHGYHSHVLMDFVRKEYKHDRIKKIVYSLNPGDTTFLLKNKEEMQGKSVNKENTRKYFMKSENIQFSRWEKNDLLLAKRLWQNKEVYRYLADVVSNDEVVSKLNEQIYNESKYHVECWPMFTNTHEFLGACGLIPVKGNRKRYGIEVYVCSEYWNRGFGNEAIARVLQYAFDYIDANEIDATNNPENVYFGKILAKNGFVMTDDSYNERTKLFHPNFKLTK
ncbi:MAG: GNAT family N-acetyltransferase [Erysipelotrichaceae bacterium]|nr:GNAT family N-acetyltransferase [Erysipelotrichaceae bacterium]